MAGISVLVALSTILSFSLVSKADPTQDQIDLAARSLADDYRPFVITLDRDIKVYHYFNDKSFNADWPLNSWMFEHRLNRAINYFWVDTGDLFSNEALYAAHDPVSSRWKGDTLLEITIRKGSRILLGHLKTINLSDKTINAIKVVMGSTFFPPHNRMDSDLQVIPRPVLASALKLLGGVEVATYDWGGAEKNAVCSTVSGAAFIIMGTPVDLSLARQGFGVIARNMSVVGYTPLATDFSDPVKRAAYERIERFLHVSSQVLNVNIASANVGPIPAEERSAWREQIFSCESVHSIDNLQ